MQGGSLVGSVRDPGFEMGKINLGIRGLSGNLGRNDGIEESYARTDASPPPPPPLPKKGGNSLSRFSLLASFRWRTLRTEVNVTYDVHN